MVDITVGKLGTVICSKEASWFQITFICCLRCRRCRRLRQDRMQPAMTRVHLTRDVYLIAAEEVPDRPDKLLIGSSRLLTQ